MRVLNTWIVGYAAAYDRKAQFDPTEDISVLLDAGMGKDSIVIELGAGTGTSPWLRPDCSEVIAVDVSAAMVEMLRQRVIRRRHHKRPGRPSRIPLL